MTTQDIWYCGCSLRTGTQIILWISVVFSLIIIFAEVTSGVEMELPFSKILSHNLISIICLAISAIGIYGIEKEKPGCLIPYLTLQVITMVLIMCIMVIFGFWGMILSIIPVIFAKDSGEIGRSFANTIGVVTWITVIFYEFSLLVVLGFVFSLYRPVLKFFKIFKIEVSRQEHPTIAPNDGIVSMRNAAQAGVDNAYKLEIYMEPNNLCTST